MFSTVLSVSGTSCSTCGAHTYRIYECLAGCGVRICPDCHDDEARPRHPCAWRAWRRARKSAHQQAANAAQLVLEGVSC